MKESRKLSNFQITGFQKNNPYEKCHSTVLQREQRHNASKWKQNECKWKRMTAEWCSKGKQNECNMKENVVNPRWQFWWLPQNPPEKIRFNLENVSPMFITNLTLCHVFMVPFFAENTFRRLINGLFQLKNATCPKERATLRDPESAQPRERIANCNFVCSIFLPSFLPSFLSYFLSLENPSKKITSKNKNKK